MANALYDTGRQAFANGGINLTSDAIKIAPVTAAYAANMASDQYWSTVNGIAGAVAATPVQLTGITDAAGVFKAANVTFNSVASGSAITQLVIYKDTGNAATSQLIARMDTGTNLPVTPNGGNITLNFDATNGIFKL